MDAEVLKQRLESVESVLSQLGETDYAGMIRRALDAPEQDLRAFLVSNELWGGAGSIADQAGISRSREERGQLEAALVRLGLEQMRQGVVNVRTEMWVDAFSKWQREDI